MACSPAHGCAAAVPRQIGAVGVCDAAGDRPQRGVRAVIPDVRVTVVNADTGLQRSTVGGALGAFAITLRPPARYRLTAEHDGFVPTDTTIRIDIPFR